MRTYAPLCLAVYETRTKNTQLQEPVEILLSMIFCKTVVNVRSRRGGSVCCAEGGKATALSRFFSRLFKNLKSSDNNQAQASE